MKAREVNELLRNKVDPHLLKVLVKIAENQSILSQKIIEMAQLIDQMANLMNMHIVTMETLKSAVDKMRAKDEPETEH